MNHTVFLLLYISAIVEADIDCGRNTLRLPVSLNSTCCPADVPFGLVWFHPHVYAQTVQEF